MKGFRTIAFNIVGFVVTGIAVIDPTLLGANGPAIVAGVLSVGNFVLRFLTDTAVGIKS